MDFIINRIFQLNKTFRTKILSDSICFADFIFNNIQRLKEFQIPPDISQHSPKICFCTLNHFTKEHWAVSQSQKTNIPIKGSWKGQNWYV